MNESTDWTLRRCYRFISASLLFLVISSCAVGPDFEHPAPPQVDSYTSVAMPAALTPGGGEPSQAFVMGQTLSAQWWEVYNSQRLNQVIIEALAGNPTLESAKATLAQAQQLLIAARGGFYPQVDIGASAQRQHAGDAPITNLYSLGGTVSYVPDVFGGTRRGVEQQEALADNQRYQLAAAYLALTGNAVTQSLNIAAIRLQISAVQDILADDEKNLQLVQLKFEGGKASHLDVLTAESQLSNDKTLLPSLKQQLSEARHALTILTGKFPGQWNAPDFDLAEFSLPAQLPVTLPSELAHKRPDILAAEARLHAASAAIGVATSRLYPTITLSGSWIAESSSTTTLFQSSNQFRNLLANLTFPIFHGGALRAQKQAAIDAYQSSLALYQQTVLTAFGQVADVLRALEHDSELVEAQNHALENSSRSLELHRLSYQAGKSDLLQFLDAERAYQQARLGYARAQAQRFQDTAQLFVAMGGGWWDEQNTSMLYEDNTAIHQVVPAKADSSTK